MEMMIHFAFCLVKISVQASLYATFLLVAFLLIARLQPGSWFDRVARRKLVFWFRSGLLFSIGLFVFMFTYWGFHGFGDGPRVPIGHGLFVDNTNWTEHGYIHGLETSDGHDLMMTEFLVVNDKLLGNLDSWFDRYVNAYFIYDMSSGTLTEYTTRNDFDAYTSSHGLPSSTSLRTFEDNYNERWGGLWFWMLP
jgi:energy-coupling factor transporter transmembrane protein EcfT